ncbi:MAG: molybdopterin molybdotransferase MoeA [Campylobacterota bacterium]|nr:molybdopterin molybdotransferase MoeA [Campylobacterota bacterium]
MAVDVYEAFNLIDQHIKIINYEIVPIESSIGKISAENIFATHFMPRFNNSAMDGYGVKLDDANKVVKVLDTILAGSKKTTKIKKQQTIKIMTGARVPDSVDAIVPQEDVEILDNNKVKLPDFISPFAHIRFVGEDIKNGELLISKGDDINFAKITLFASQGITHVKIYKNPKVTVFASGEELKLHYESIKKYQIYNSNTPTLIARVKELGCDVNFIGMAHDSIDSLKELIINSLDSDLIITSGGVSVGEADFTKEAFDALKMTTIFDGIKIKPGKPTILGKINKTVILNLPGNPLASSLIFELFGKIIVQKLSGSKNIFHNTIKTKNSIDLNNKKGRITIIPGYFDGDKFEASHKRSPGMVSILSKCNALIVLDENTELIKENEEVNILPINWKFFTNKQKDFLTYEK